MRSTLARLPIYFIFFIADAKSSESEAGLDSKKFGIVFLDKKSEDLGVRDLGYLNKALLSKWNWCFSIE